MPTIDDQIAELQSKLDGLLKQKNETKAEPLTLSDLIGTQIPTQLPIGTQLGPNFAPSGLMFTGGSPFRPDNRGAILNNALNLGFGLQKELAKLRKKNAAETAAAGASSNAGS